MSRNIDADPVTASQEREPEHALPRDMRAAYIVGSHATPQQNSAQSVFMGARLIRKIQDGEYSVLEFAEAKIDDSDLRSIGRAMIVAHADNGIRVGPTDVNGSAEGFYDAFRVGFRLSRKNLISAMAMYAHWALGVTEMPGDYKGQSELTARLFERQADGSLRPEAVALGLLFDQLKAAYDRSNPKYARIREEQTAAFTVLDDKWLGLELTNDAIMKRKAATSAIHRSAQDLYSLASWAAEYFRPKMEQMLGREIPKSALAMVVGAMIQQGIDLRSRGFRRKTSFEPATS